MSATLQPRWLGSVDFAGRVDVLDKSSLRIPAADRKGNLFDVVRTVERQPKTNEPVQIAALVLARHAPASLSLVIVNTVKRAVEVAAALQGGRKGRSKARPVDQLPDVRLVHSRFRGHERGEWTAQFLAREHCSPERLPPAGRIIVATQVVEAGVDISARLLVTDLAPWSSLVQRFGRCARYRGESGCAVVIGAAPEVDRDAAPYEALELQTASRELDELGPDAGPGALETFEEALSADRRAALFPYEPRHALRRKDLDDLFDTTAALNGADLDVGRFIRSGDDRDVSVFWRDVDPDERRLEDQRFPSRAELCPAPLFGKDGFDEGWRQKGRAGWVYDYLAESWRRLVARPPPGSVILLSSRGGGYSYLGWDLQSRSPVEVVTPAADPALQRLEQASSGQGDDALSQAAEWQSIATHGRDVGACARELGHAAALSEELTRLLELAGRWHDAGKAHPIFQGALTTAARAASPDPAATDWAKAPGSAWRHHPYADRRGFRHELVSTLMLFEALHQRQPTHPGLLGDVLDVLRAVGMEPAVPAPGPDSVLVREVASLSSEQLDLVLYLVCSHHGKVRCQWSASPNDAEHSGRLLGVQEGDVVPNLNLWSGDALNPLAGVTLHLDCASMGLNARYGRSWSERVEALLGRFGPFQLAYLEALLRAADWRASASLGAPS